METVFWIALFGSAYSYVLYPALLFVLPKRPTAPGPNPTCNADQPPPIALVITVHNEEKRLRAKLENTLRLDYPRDRLDIVVASDASSDATDAIAGEYRDRGVRLVRSPTRSGKEHAQKLAIAATSSPLLVFSDVATRLDPDALRRVALTFCDPGIGAISSEDRFYAENGELSGEGAYIRYEMALRRLESAVGSLVGLSGSFFAARREVCEPWDTESPSDFNTALNALRRGYVAVSDPELLGYYPDLKGGKGEYRRKVRTILRGMTALFRHKDVLNPFTFGIFAFQVFSHKVMRWLVPWFLLACLISSSYLALKGDTGFYTWAMLVQLAFYGLVAVGTLASALRELRPVKIPFFFMQANLAAAHALLAYLVGRRAVVWTPSVR